MLTRMLRVVSAGNELHLRLQCCLTANNTQCAVGPRLHVSLMQVSLRISVMYVCVYVYACVCVCVPVAFLLVL